VVERGGRDLLRVPSPDLEREQQSATTHLAVAELSGDGPQAVREVEPGRDDHLKELRLLDRLDHGASDGGHERIAVEGTALVAVFEAADAVGGDERREWDSATQPLAQRDDVGLDARMLVAEEAAGSSDAGLDLVDDE